MILGLANKYRELNRHRLVYFVQYFRIINLANPKDQVTLVKNAGSNQWSVDGSFGDLPKHREENDNVYERQYSADEVSFNVWKVVGGSEQLLYGYDGTNYTFGEGAEESIYTPFYDHDANEDWDGDWHLQISNSVGQKIEPRNINIGLQKTWQGGTPENASATFVLRRYKQTEYADYQGLEHNANILVLLTDSNGQVLSTIQTKSGKNVYIDATFAPNKTGTLTFTYQGQNYTVSNQTTTGAKVTVRSDPIRVTGNNGDTISVRMTAGDLANLAEGTSSNLRITDRQLENDLGEDTNFSRSITLPNDGDWQYKDGRRLSGQRLFLQAVENEYAGGCLSPVGQSQDSGIRGFQAYERCL